jgi:bifunctional DNase/RNase
VSYKKIKLKLIGITFSQVQAGAYALILAENEGVRRFPVMIGTPEAQSIAIFMEGLHPPRPLTHDLFVSLTGILNIKLKEIFISKYEDGIFFSELIFDDGIKEIHLDARTSDAIAIAIRAKAEIYITEDIMNEVSVETDEEITGETEIITRKPERTLDKTDIDGLQKLLDEAIVMENYEKASYIRDIINKLK